MTWSIISIVAWIAVVLGTLGAVSIIGLSISEQRHKRRLEEMRNEAELKRRDYLDVSPHFEDWTPSEKSNHRANFLQ
jgi:hypothetical protein